MWHLLPCLSSGLLLGTVSHRRGQPPGPITTASARPVLQCHSMSSTTSAVKTWGDRGAAPLSSVKVTHIPRQYWVSGQPGNSHLSRDWDGEWEGVLPEAPISSRPFWPLGDVMVQPSIWRLAPDIWSSRPFDLVAIDMPVVVMN